MDPISSTDTGGDNEPDSATNDEDAHPTYSYIDPGCPICGNTKFSSTEEGVPNGFDSHYVYVTCANCKTSFTIEYRAIDLFWYDGRDGQHSAVSQGLLEPTETDYVDEAGYGALPDGDLLANLDWPLECECDEHLTGNHIVSDPTVLADHDVDYDDADRVLIRCPNCEAIASETPSEAS